MRAELLLERDRQGRDQPASQPSPSPPPQFSVSPAKGPAQSGVLWSPSVNKIILEKPDQRFSKINRKYRPVNFAHNVIDDLVMIFFDHLVWFCGFF